MTKPPISRWIVEQRKAHGWKAEDVANRLRQMGFDAEDTTYRTWEASRRPKPETIKGLEQLFGSPAPRDEEPQPDMAALIARLDRNAEMLARQAEEISALTAAVLELAQGQAGLVTGLTAAIRERSAIQGSGRAAPSRERDRV